MSLLDTIIHYTAYPQELTGIDVILPFFLFFIVLFIGLSRTNIMRRNQAAVVSVILSLITVAPHVTETYPSCYDPVVLVNNAMPQFGLMIIAVFTLILILFFVGIRGGSSNFVYGLISIGAVGFIIYSFFTAKSGYYRDLCPAPPQFFPFLGELVEKGWLAILIIIIVVWLLIRYMRGTGAGGGAGGGGGGGGHP